MKMATKAPPPTAWAVYNENTTSRRKLVSRLWSDLRGGALRLLAVRARLDERAHPNRVRGGVFGRAKRRKLH